MRKRYVSIWFRYLVTDWFSVRTPSLKYTPFVVSKADHGRMVVSAANASAKSHGIETGMVLADARAIFPSLVVADDKAGLSVKLLQAFAGWCIRFTPVVSLDPPDGLILDATGCAHLWKGEEPYITEIIKRISLHGYSVKAGIADTIGAAWAVARYHKSSSIVSSAHQPASMKTIIPTTLQTHTQQTHALQSIIPSGQHSDALKSLPPEALRLDPELSLRFHKLGLHEVGLLLGLQRSALRRRFGHTFLLRLDQALGNQEEWIQPVHPAEPYQERLPCLEPIVTRTGIEIALQTLLNTLCARLKQEQNGLRQASLKCYRTDGKIETIEIATHLPSHHAEHLYKLFDIKLSSIRPESGIDLFILQAGKVEPHHPLQEKLWQASTNDHDERISELIDRITSKFGERSVHRYLPDEHHWPERSFKKATTLQEQATTGWRQDQPRPVQLFFKPVPIQVTAPIPDYPPMLFRHKGKLHKIMKADGPERIEQEWWIQDGEHRDYYRVEDEEGNRFWLFRSGHYTGDKAQQWFIHGLFA